MRPTKIVIRHLPPTMTEKEFREQIELPEHDFFYFAEADWSLGIFATCRAYINLKNYDDVFLFRDRFDGYVFVDSKGAEYTALVEFAPFQGFLKNRSRRNDNKANTIEQESHYQQFLTKLEEEREAAAKGSEIKLEFTLDRKKEEITSTPLLQYLANKKEKRREEAKKRTEEKRRQREEEKERRRDKQQTQVTKIMTSERSNKHDNRGSNKHDKESGGGGSGRNNTSNEGGERQNTRTKRKAEREQRRKEQREKAKLEENEKSMEKPENKPKEQVSSEEKSNRESKKYSEKRERDRERNRNRREKEKQKQETTNNRASISTATETTESVAPPTTDEAPVKQKSKEEQISETVRNFIRSVANVKEFIPKHKQVQAEEVKEKPMENLTQDKPIIDKPVTVEKVEQIEKTDISVAPKTMDPPQTELTQKQKEQQQKREERRIRNKDRPSIAIYTPKPRLSQRLSEESDVTPSASKSSHSSPTSDCDNSRKEDSKKESTKKKVSRYSERRSERRSSTKAKSSETEDSGTKSAIQSPENVNQATETKCNSD